MGSAFIRVFVAILQLNTGTILYQKDKKTTKFNELFSFPSNNIPQHQFYRYIWTLLSLLFAFFWIVFLSLGSACFFSAVIHLVSFCSASLCTFSIESERILFSISFFGALHFSTYRQSVVLSCILIHHFGDYIDDFRPTGKKENIS